MLRTSLKAEEMIQQMINVRGEKQDTPLHCACAKRNLNMVKLLVKRGAEIDATNGRVRTPLHVACHHNQLEIAEYLISQ